MVAVGGNDVLVVVASAAVVVAAVGRQWRRSTAPRRLVGGRLIVAAAVAVRIVVVVVVVVVVVRCRHSQPQERHPLVPVVCRYRSNSPRAGRHRRRRRPTPRCIGVGWGRRAGLVRPSRPRPRTSWARWRQWPGVGVEVAEVGHS